MNTEREAEPCPHCGEYPPVHKWAGEGSCQGAAIVTGSTYFALESQALKAEIERLTTEVKTYAQIIKGFSDWRSLLLRAADALEGHLPACHKDAWLVKELREAAK